MNMKVPCQLVDTALHMSPFTIRKAYQLPTTEHQDAMYAYLFYRILQRAENVYLFYNTETDVLGRGEKNRFLQQLLF